MGTVMRVDFSRSRRGDIRLSDGLPQKMDANGWPKTFPGQRATPPAMHDHTAALTRAYGELELAMASLDLAEGRLCKVLQHIEAYETAGSKRHPAKAYARTALASMRASKSDTTRTMSLLSHHPTGAA